MVIKVKHAVLKKVAIVSTTLVIALGIVGASLPLLANNTAHAATSMAYTPQPFNGLALTPDRQAPSGGAIVNADSLTLSVDNTKANVQPNTTFYQTEGLTSTIASSTSIKAQLYIDPAWTGKKVGVGLWGITKSATADDSAYPIIQYTSVADGGFVGFRVFDTMNGGYTNLDNVTATPGQTYTLEIAYNDTTKNYDFSINNVVVLSKTAMDGENTYDSFQGVIFNSYNYATGDAADNYSVTWSNFSRGTAQLAEPTNLTPADGTVTTNPAFTDTFSAVPGAASYEYRTSNTRNGDQLGNIIYSDSSLTHADVYDTTGSTITRANSGTPDGTYYWQVRAVDAQGVAGAWSAIAGVTVDTTAPAAPVAQNPNGWTNGAMSFAWSDVSDSGSAVTYELQYSRTHPNNVADTDVKGITGTSYSPQGGIPDGPLFWRVRAVDAAGNVGAWSNLQAATIDTTAPVLHPSITSGTLSGTQTLALTVDETYIKSSGIEVFDANHQSVAGFGATGDDARSISHSFDTTSVPDGTYTIEYTASDILSHTTTEDYTVTIQNAVVTPPVVTPTAPAINITNLVSGQSVTGDANDNFNFRILGTVTDATGLAYYRTSIHDASQATPTFNNAIGCDNSGTCANGGARWENDTPANVTNPSELFNWDAGNLANYQAGKQYQILVEAKNLAGAYTSVLIKNVTLNQNYKSAAAAPVTDSTSNSQTTTSTSQVTTFAPAVVRSLTVTQAAATPAAAAQPTTTDGTTTSTDGTTGSTGSVLGDSTTTTPTSTTKDSGVLGDSTVKNPAGLAWFWYVPMIVAAAALVYAIVRAITRRSRA